MAPDPQTPAERIETLLTRIDNWLVAERGPSSYNEASDLIVDILPELKRLTAAEQQLAEANGRSFELAARVSFVCGVDTEDTMRQARANLVTRLEYLEQQLAEMNRVMADRDGWANVHLKDMARIDALEADATALRQERDEALALAYTDPRTQTRSWQTAYQDAHAGNVALTAQLEAAWQERDFQQARADKRVAAYERLSGDSAWCERHWPHDHNPHDDCQSCRADAAEARLAARDAEIQRLIQRWRDPGSLLAPRWLICADELEALASPSPADQEPETP